MSPERPRANRRFYLRWAVGSLLPALAGCLSNEANPDPVAISENHSCAVCNMIVQNHPGPSGHGVYPNEPQVYGVQDGIVPFCSTICAYDYYFEMEEEEISPEVLYLTDYSKVNWEVYDQSGTKFITAHFAAESQTRVHNLTFVVDSDVKGAMGQSAIGFSNREDGKIFSNRYGGDMYKHVEMSRELIESLGFT